MWLEFFTLRESAHAKRHPPFAWNSGARRASRSAALSSGVAEALVQALPALRKRVSVIPNAGYDREVERLAQEQPAISVPTEPWFLGCGRLTAQKDFLTLLRAFARIKDETGGELWI